MLSLDPFMGKSGYPLLLQTGETANGVTPLMDRQHPHDFVMELAGPRNYAAPVAQKHLVPPQSDRAIWANRHWPGLRCIFTGFPE